MNIKLKNKKTSLFAISFLSAVCSLFFSCNSSDLENTVFNKVVHPREYVFDIFDIDEAPKFKRERGTKKLIYSVDFTDYLKYDMPQAGDKLTLKYKGKVNKDVEGAINVNIAGLPANKSETYIFASNLSKNDIVEDQVTFTLTQDLSEVVFNLKFDNPKKYFSLTFELEQVANTTDTKAEKKALEKAIKYGQQIVEVSTISGPVVEYEEAVTENHVESEDAVKENKAQDIDLEDYLQETDEKTGLAYAQKGPAKSRGNPISSIKEAPYYKLEHPRRYYFDIYKIDTNPMLKRDKETNKLKYSVDFTSLVKEDMPKAGDTLVFINQGYANKDIPGIIYASLEGVPEKNEIFSTGLKKKETFRNKLTFLLTEDLDKVKLNLEVDNQNGERSVFITLEQAIFTTDTGEELKDYKKALKQGRTVIKWNQEPKKQEVPEVPIEQEEEPEVIEDIKEENIAEETTENPSEEVPTEDTEQRSENNAEEQLPEETEQEIVQVPVVVPEKTPEQLLEEEKARLQAEQEKIEEERAKLEAERAKFEAEKESNEQKALQEQEQLKQKQKLEETIAAVTNTNVKRYEKEYLNDYAVPGYTFDMEEKKPEPSTLFENPNEANDFGLTLLMDAAKEGNDWKIKALINAGADVNLKDNDGWTALMYAVRYHGNMNCVELLIDAGADIKAQNNYGTSALILASNYNSNPEILKKLLSYYSPNEKDVLKSFIQVLTENQDDEYIQMIKVNLFLDISVPLNSLFNGKTPLMYAAESGRSTKVIEMLMENSNTAIRSREGKTAFDYASENPKLKHDDIYWSLNNK